MLVSRRRRGASGRVRTALLDAVSRTEGLGLTVVGVYDASIFASTSSWVDARGATSGGPTITLTGSPTLSNGVYTFDGSTQYGRASNGRLSEITGAGAMVLIGAAPATAASAETLAALSNDSASGVLTVTRSLSNGNLNEITTGAAASAAGGVRVIHVRRTAASGGSVTGGIQVGASAEVTATLALADNTASRLTIAGSRAATPAALSDVSLGVVVLVKGAYSAAAASIWNQYGVLRGATV